MTQRIIKLPPAKSDEVIVGRDRISIHLTTHSPAVREALEDHDPVARTHQMLDVGARALLGAVASAEAQATAEAMAAQVQALKRYVAEVRDNLTEHADGLFAAEDGEVTNRITGVVDELETLINSTFDADSTTSAIAKIQAAVGQTIEDLNRVVRRQLRHALDPEGDGLWARSLKQLGDRLEKLEASVTRVGQEVAAAQASATMLDRSAIKGAVYEEIVASVGGQVAAAQGDVLEHVGTAKGAIQRRTGDFVVAVNAEDLRKGVGCYAIEAKDRSLSLRKTLAEADAARRNREADAVVVVFSSQEHAPTSVPFTTVGDTAIAVLDKEDPDPLALRVAMAWARSIVRQAQTRDDIDVDHERMEQAIERVRRAIEKMSVIKRCFTAAGKAAREGRGHVETLSEEIDSALDELHASVHGTAGK